MKLIKICEVVEVGELNDVELRNRLLNVFKKFLTNVNIVYITSPIADMSSTYVDIVFTRGDDVLKIVIKVKNVNFIEDFVKLIEVVVKTLSELGFTPVGKDVRTNSVVLIRRSGVHIFNRLRIWLKFLRK